MTINFNSIPYHDDYDETKDFHRILFKPGFAVQARELTQLQTILQKQVTRFGDHVFKDGSLVIPGNTYLHKNYNYVKIQAAYNGVAVNVNNFLNREIKGQTTGIRAQVVSVTTTSGGDPATLFVKYIDSGSSYTSTVFQAEEIILTNDGGTQYGATIFPTSPTGKTIAVSIDNGVYYVKGSFVRVGANTIIPSKYNSFTNTKVGLEIVESIVSKDDDDTLLDPAINTYNYFAPGADRYKISLNLSSRDLTNTISSDNFIELMRIENGDITSRKIGPGYNILADELARRTADESGDYVVTPFALSFIEHLKSNTINSPDGVLSVANNGNAQLGVAVLSAGKAYVRGYRVESDAKKFISFPKPRDTDIVTNAIIRTPIGNYVEVSNIHSIPDFTTELKTIQLYDRYSNTRALASGNIVGNATVRGFDYSSGNIMIGSGKAKTFIFNVKMDPGKTFARDVKSLYSSATTSVSPAYTSNNFVADIVPSYITIRGFGNTINGANMVQGINTFFTTDLKVGDYISLSGNVLKNYRINNIISPSNLTLDASVEFSGSSQTISRHQANLLESSYSSYIFPISSAYNTIKDFADVSYRVRRVIGGTLVASSITITAASDESFASITDSNMFAVIGSGTSKGNIIRIDSSMVTQSTVRNWTVNFTTYGLTTNDILIYVTVIKNPSDSTLKQKTIVSTYLDVTTDANVNAGIISLNYADVYSLSNVLLSANVLGTPFYTSNSITDITSQFSLDTGQTSTFYDISKIIKKPGTPRINGPIRIYFSYYSHGNGDFFRADSYPDYENIPKFVDNGITYNLRDCLDFRPRINNAGTGFSGTGSSVGEFLDNDNDVTSDITFYLPRTDKISLTETGNLVYNLGISSLEPKEPEPSNSSMPLYVVKFPAYTFDLKNDPEITPVYQKRYTMRDIGKLETRIKNLEYYTSLSLLELDTALFSVKDSFGLDRFKNGFIVDSFTGHSVGDVYNVDYNISMDFKNGHLRPGIFTKNIKLSEKSVNDTQRTSNGYMLTNDFITLAYTDEPYITSASASKDESVNPFNVYVFTGVLNLTPPGDTWIEETFKPIIYNNADGTYDALVPDSVGQKTYGSSWEWYKSGVEGTKVVDTNSVVFTETNVSGDATSVVLPYMRSVTIKFRATGMKPNTKMFVFFNNYNFTNFCSANANSVSSGSFMSADTGNIFSDRFGTVDGFLTYSPKSSGIKINNGQIPLVITDSSTNSTNKESFATAFFSAQGTLVRKTPRVAATIDNGEVIYFNETGSGYVDIEGNNVSDRAAAFFAAVSAREAAAIMAARGLTDSIIATYGGVDDQAAYSSVIDTGIAASSGILYDRNGNATNLWESGGVNNICAAAGGLDAGQKEYVSDIYGSVVDLIHATINSGGPWPEAAVQWFNDGIANGSIALDANGQLADVNAVIANAAATITLGYITNNNDTEV